MKAYRLLIALSIAAMILLMLQPAGSVKVLAYHRFPLSADLPTHVAVESNDRVWLSLPSRQAVAIFNPSSGDLTLVSLPGAPGKLVYYEGYVLCAMAKQGMLAVIDSSSLRVAAYEVPAEVVDIHPSPDGTWLSIPDASRLVKFSPKEMRVLRDLKVDVAYGEGVIADVNGKLWVIEKGYMALLLVDESSGGSKRMEFKNQTYLVAAAPNGDAWVVDLNGKLSRVTQDMRIVEEISLPLGTIVAPPLLVSKFGSVVYFSRATHAVGEVFKGDVDEIKLGYAMPWHPTMAPDGNFWFIEIFSNSLGVVSISRPPSVQSVNLEKVGKDSYRISVRVEDREMDVTNVIAIIESYVEGRLRANETMQLLPQDGLYVGNGKVGISDGTVKIKVRAMDLAGNSISSAAGNITVRGGEVVGLEAGKQEGAAVEVPQIYILISELLLLIPLALAVAYFIMKRRQRRK